MNPIISFNIRPKQCASILAGVLLHLSFLGSNGAYAASQDELKGVSSEISKQSSSITAQRKKLNALQSDLEKYDVSISSIGKEISGTQSQLNTVQANLKKLQEQKASLEKDQTEQAENLETLIQTFYLTNRPQEISKLFQAGKASDLDRMSQYYQHLAKQRTKAIEKLEKTHQELALKETQLTEEQKKQAALLAKQKAKEKELLGTKTKRQSTVTNIKKTIQSDETKLAELRQNEAKLKAEIAAAAKRAEEARKRAEAKRQAELARRKAEEERRRKAAEAAKAAGQAPPKEEPIEDTAPVSYAKGPMNGLSSQRGKLPWPIKGTVLHRYGTTQSGQITWKGIVIAANEGMNVRAVAPGEVVFADWLRGYGLVILVDHGRGDMSLYGYNQTLLKKEGDRVSGGEPLATAGSSGGQSRPSVYFEIRRNSQPQNPQSWLSK